MSGQLVEKVTNLETIDLVGNWCIDEVFDDSTSISIVSKIIDENCGYRNQTAIKKLFDLSCGISLSHTEYLRKYEHTYKGPECITLTETGAFGNKILAINVWTRKITCKCI